MKFLLDCTRGINGYSVFSQLGKLLGSKAKLRKMKDKIMPRNFREIKNIIEKTPFSANVKKNSIRFFRMLAMAEANVHKTSMSTVHMHEVARKENIFRTLEIFSMLENAGRSGFTCTMINTGKGIVKTAHGRLAVPTHATRKLLNGMPTFKKGNGELTTPTGACWARILCKRFVKDASI